MFFGSETVTSLIFFPEQLAVNILCNFSSCFV